jgi:hypothetical protein
MSSRHTTPRIFRAPKRRGELSELAFDYRAASVGLGLSRPDGDSQPFDRIVTRRSMYRVQIKSTRHMHGNAYHLVVHRGGRPYRRGEYDFLAAHIVPHDVWYIIPYSAVKRRWAITVFPNNNRQRKTPGQFEKYRERWDLFQ